MKVVVAIAEAIEKRKILLPPYQRGSPEATSGIYSRSLFWWFNGLMRIGYRRVVKKEDMFPIDEEMKSSFLTERAQKSWDDAPKTRSHALFWSTTKANRKRTLTCVFPRLCSIGFRYAQPLLLARTVKFVDSEEWDTIGWGLTGAFGVVSVGMAIGTGSYYHMTYRFVTAVRGGLIGFVYAKTVELSITALDEGAAITLTSNDAGE
ncbi:MAG: hypothetical protein CL912_18905 [Deltaproteobacteria bacterium]|nr:hypothetical protein [Deltaproteobacteria bacterium]